jgi:hypothetical protein
MVDVVNGYWLILDIDIRKELFEVFGIGCKGVGRKSFFALDKPVKLLYIHKIEEILVSKLSK